MKTIITTMLLIIALQSYSQSTPYLWAKNAECSNSGYGEGWTIASDHSGNVYEVGVFSDAIVFGTDTLYSYLEGVYLVKYNSSGTVLWARSSDINSAAAGYGVAIDANNNVFITGLFTSSTVSFGVDTLTNISNSGSDCIFTVKYDSSGNVIWAEKGGSTSSAAQLYPKSITVDPFGNSFVTGYYRTPMITFGSYTISNGGTQNCFLTKYDPSGNVIWLQGSVGGGGNGNFSYCNATDAFGNVYMAGYFLSSTIQFGNITLNNPVVNNPGLFLTKYDSAGNTIWAKTATGPAVIKGITTDAVGNIFVTGSMIDTLVIGNFTLLNSLTFQDFLIAKFDSSGNVLWAKNATGRSTGYNVTCDSSGNSYAVVSGFTYAIPVSFDAITLNPPINSSDPLYIVKYNSSGDAVCGYVLGSGGHDNCGIAIGPGNSIYAGSYYRMNPFIVGNDSLDLTGTYDPFVLRLHPGEVVTSAFTIDTTEGCKPLTVQFTNNSVNATSFLWIFNNNFTSNEVNPTHIYSSSGNYTITLIAYDSSACGITIDTSHIMAHFTVYPPPVQPVITQSYDTLISSYTYGNQWYLDTTAIIGATNQRNVTTNSGCYYVIITDTNGCKGQSDSICLIYTGMKDLSLANKISIFPNPATDELTITLSDNTIKSCIINLYDLVGEKVIHELSNLNSQLSIDLSYLPQGIYFLDVNIDGERMVKKVVKIN